VVEDDRAVIEEAVLPQDADASGGSGLFQRRRSSGEPLLTSEGCRYLVRGGLRACVPSRPC
jgi:hypothetical protein